LGLLDDLTVPHRTYLRLSIAAAVRVLRWLTFAFYLIALTLGLLLWRLW
jgi:hypothetical protein